MTARAGTAPQREREQQLGHGLPTPLYHQIFLILRNQIVEGRLLPGALVSGEEELARQYGVSRITARRALAELAAEGLVTRGRGRGTHVARRSEPAPIHAGVEGLIENLIAMGLKTQVAVIEFGYEPASPEVAAALRVPAGTEVQRTVRVRSLDIGPFSHLTTYVPQEVGRKFTDRDLAHEPLLSLLERSGVVIGSADQTMSATLADTRAGPLLDVSIGAPLLRMTRVVQDVDERPVEYLVGLYRPDRYQFRMSLDRVRGRRQNTWTARVTPKAKRSVRTKQPSAGESER